MKRCYYCEATTELRPYGPGGAYVCFPCATTPERNAATESAFGALLDANGAISSSGAVILTSDGPEPFVMPGE